MNKLKNYVIVKRFKSPQVVQTGMSHSPAKVGWRVFKKGEIVKGELKHANGQPSFVLLGRMTVLPLSCVKEIVTRPVQDKTSNFSSEPSADQKVKKYMAKTPPKIQYMDAVLLGAVVGGVGWWYAEKKNLVDSLNPKAKIYAAGAGALLAWYFVYRYNNRKPKTIKVTQ